MKRSKIKTVELFAGIGGFRLATDQFGIATIWANDIDDHASKVYADRFGEGEFVKGDINKLINQIPEHDLLTAGFPCQPFSSAGKKQGIQDPRGTLFESIIKILKLRKPKYFILENVKRLIEMDSGKHFATILLGLSSLDYLIEWRVVNTMYFGLPQNRKRIIITGRLREKGDIPGKITKLLSAEEVKLLNSNGSLFNLKKWTPTLAHKKTFPNWGIAYNGKFFGRNFQEFSEAKSLVKLESLLQQKVPAEFVFTADTLKRLENSVFVNRFVDGIHILYNQKGGARMGYTVFATDGLAPTLTSATSRHYERYKFKNTYRRLTNTEYARIQGFPDDHCSAVSSYKQYKLYGNAVSPMMVKWAVEKLMYSRGNELNIYEE